MATLYNQWESLLTMFPRLYVLNYSCSYSGLFNLHTLRTVCECRWQPTLSHERKTGSSDFRISYSPSLSHSHSISLVVSSFSFNIVFPDKQEVTMLDTLFLHNLDTFINCIISFDYLLSLPSCFYPICLCFSSLPSPI